MGLDERLLLFFGPWTLANVWAEVVLPPASPRTRVRTRTGGGASAGRDIRIVSTGILDRCACRAPLATLLSNPARQLLCYDRPLPRAVQFHHPPHNIVLLHRKGETERMSAEFVGWLAVKLERTSFCQGRLMTFGLADCGTTDAVGGARVSDRSTWRRAARGVPWGAKGARTVPERRR